MAQLQFFMNEQDTQDFTHFLVSKYDCRFTMDGWDNPDLPQYNKPEEIAKLLDIEGYPPRFYVSSYLWTGFPYRILEINHNDGRLRWYIAQRYGGPAFDYSVSRPRLVEGKKQIVPGWFGVYASYYIKENDPTTFDRPATMKSAFDAVNRYLKRFGVRSRCDGYRMPGPWILPGALKEFEDGCWLRMGEDRFQPCAK